LRITKSNNPILTPPPKEKKPGTPGFLLPYLIGFLFSDLIVFFAIYIKKYLKAKEELWELKYFTTQNKTKSLKNPRKETKKILQDIRTL
jgi:hypothetical protein